MTSHDPTVPPGLPAPTDDGAADHLPGQAVPALALPDLALAEVAAWLRRHPA